jgi:hypothetical protein
VISLGYDGICFQNAQQFERELNFRGIFKGHSEFKPPKTKVKEERVGLLPPTLRVPDFEFDLMSSDENVSIK